MPAATCGGGVCARAPGGRAPQAASRPAEVNRARHRHLKSRSTVVTAAQQLAQEPAPLEQQQPMPEPPQHYRRSGVLRLALLSAAAAAATPGGSGPQQLVLPPRAVAAANSLPPLQSAAASAASGGPRSSLVLADLNLLPLQPGPVAFPRRQLGLNFAVLLMRSGYEAVDDLDFIPMDEFQKKFWKLRQAEWEPYTLLHSPLRITQGKLEDPLYFDFINYSQAAAAGLAMTQGKQVFEEYDEESEGKLLVTRDPLLADNSLLPARFFERQGDRIYRGLVEGFRGEQFGAPPPCRPGAAADELLAGVQSLLDLYASRGYALKASLVPGQGSSSSSSSSSDGSGSGSGSSGSGSSSSSGSGPVSFTVRLEGPANLWSLQALAARRSTLYSQHDAAAVAAFLRASGRSSTCKLSWNDTAVTQQWTLTA